MLISEVIAKLTAIKKERGDLECFLKNYNLDVIEKLAAPYYGEVICTETNYIEGCIPECHPKYYGVYFDAD